MESSDIIPRDLMDQWQELRDAQEAPVTVVSNSVKEIHSVTVLVWKLALDLNKKYLDTYMLHIIH
jgi:hypothetical protein